MNRIICCALLVLMLVACGGPEGAESADTQFVTQAAKGTKGGGGTSDPCKATGNYLLLPWYCFQDTLENDECHLTSGGYTSEVDNPLCTDWVAPACYDCWDPDTRGWYLWHCDRMWTCDAQWQDGFQDDYACTESMTPCTDSSQCPDSQEMCQAWPETPVGTTGVEGYCSPAARNCINGGVLLIISNGVVEAF